MVMSVTDQRRQSVRRERPARHNLIEMRQSRYQIGFLKLGLFATAMLWLMYPAQAEYRVQAGDVLEISVAGIPELRQRVAVQLDGSLTLPLVGTLIVEGVPFSEIRSKIQSAVASKVFRLRTPDGRDLPRMFERDEVAAAIVEYKPVFVAGEVARSGEQPFRPRMTIRQALASAGGLLSQAQAGVASADASTLRSEYVALWLSWVKEHARVWQIKTEIGEEFDFNRSALASTSIPEATVAQILDLEIEYRARQRSDHERAKNYFRRSLVLADEQIAILTEQQQKEEQGVLADTQDLQRAMELLARGTLTNARVTDARRAVLLSSTRQLQTTSQLMQVKKSRSEFARELEKIEDQRRIRLLAELQEATVKLAGERAKLQSTEEKLHLLGVRPPGTIDGLSPFDITLFRKGADGRKRLVAVDVDTELEPGDVVQVTLRSGQVEAAAR
jgi:polysaccharide biosynthesis/export protein